MDEARIERYQARLHPLLAVLIPFLFIAALDGYLRAVVLTPALRPPPLSLVVVLALGVAEALSGRRARAKAENLATRFREIVLLAMGASAALYLLTGEPFRGRFNPVRFAIIYPLVLALAQWILSLVVHNALAQREGYLRMMQGKEGAGLASAVRDLHEEAGLAEAAVRRLISIVLGFQVALLCLVAVAPLVGRPTFAAMALAVGFVAAGFLFQLVLRGFLTEQALLGDGIVAPAGALGARSRSGAGLLFVVLGVALFVSGSSSLFPASWITDLLAAFDRWLNNRATAAPRDPRIAAVIEQMSEPDRAIGQGLEQLQGGDSRSVLADVLRVVGIVVLAAAAVGFLIFLVRPLFRREREGGGKRWRPLRAVAAALRAVGTAFRGLGASLARWLGTTRSAARAARDLVGGIGQTLARSREARKDGGAGQARRGNTRKVVREYARLVQWGQRRGVPFTAPAAPLRYARRLAAEAPELGGVLEEVGASFEEIVYSGRAVDPSRVARYYEHIDGIVKSRPSRSDR